jgi:hypothetical protein
LESSAGRSSTPAQISLARKIVFRRLKGRIFVIFRELLAFQPLARQSFPDYSSDAFIFEHAAAWLFCL